MSGGSLAPQAIQPTSGAAATAVSELLQGIGLGQYVEPFAAEGMEMEVLLSLVGDEVRPV